MAGRLLVQIRAKKKKKAQIERSFKAVCGYLRLPKPNHLMFARVASGGLVQSIT